MSEENWLIEFDEENNVVEIQYQGVNAVLLASLKAQILALQATVNAALGVVDGQLNNINTDIGGLNALVAALGGEMTDEAALRLLGDVTNGENLVTEINTLVEAIELEVETRAAALIAEAAARGAAIIDATATIVTDVAALATSITGIASQLGAAQASIITVSDALVTETSARAAQYSALQADFGDTNAAVLEESVARADEDTALALSITALTATVGGVSAAVVAEASARASADTAIASTVTALTSTVGTNTAAISSEASTRASADTAISSTVSSLSTTVGGHTASISSQATSISGIQAKYSLTIDVNGNISGYELIGTGAGSVFKILATTFQVWNGSGNVAPFAVSGGTVFMQNVVVNGSLLVAGTIVANKFVTDAGVDLTAIVPNTLNLKRQSLTAGPNVVTNGPTTTSVMAITSPMNINGHRIVVRGQSDVRADGPNNFYGAGGYFDLYRRVNGGSWVLVRAHGVLDPGNIQFDNTNYASDVWMFYDDNVSSYPLGYIPFYEDFSPPAGSVEYGVTLTTIGPPVTPMFGADGISSNTYVRNVELFVEAYFYK